MDTENIFSHHKKKTKLVNNHTIRRTMKDTKILPLKRDDENFFMRKESVGDVDFFKCKQCPFMTLSMKDIKFHWQTTHAASETQNKSQNANNVTVKCPGCSGLFYTESTLKTHLRSHHKMAARDIQKLAFSLTKEVKRNQEYIENLEVVIDGMEPYDCKSMPQVIEIVPDPPQPAGTATPSVVYDEVPITNNLDVSQMNGDDIIPEIKSDKPIYLNIAPVISLLSNSVINNGMSFESCDLQGTKSELSTEYPEVVDLSSSDLPNQCLQQNDCGKGNRKNIKKSKEYKVKAKKGRPWAAKSIGITNAKKVTTDESYLTQEFGHRCSVKDCGVRMFSFDKINFHKQCHINNTKQLFCPKCNSKFSNVESLHTHLWREHQVDMELNSCDQCPYKVYSLSRLNNYHKKIHSAEKAFVCDVCSKAFKNSKQLSNHKAVHKSKDAVPKKLTCDVCNRDFNNARMLQRHVATVHNKVKAFNCEHCQYSTAAKSSLLLHMRLHTGEKPFECTQCQYKSSDGSTLRRHMKKHSQQKSYQCKHCSYSCIQASSLKLHMKSKHSGVQTDSLHSCPICSYKSVRKANFIAHLSSHTEAEISFCDKSKQLETLRKMQENPVALECVNMISDDEDTVNEMFNYTLKKKNAQAMVKMKNDIQNSFADNRDLMLNSEGEHNKSEFESLDHCFVSPAAHQNDDFNFSPGTFEMQNNMYHPEGNANHSEFMLDNNTSCLQKILTKPYNSYDASIPRSNQPIFVKDILELASSSAACNLQNISANNKSIVPIILVKPNNSHILSPDSDKQESSSIGIISSNSHNQLLTLPVQHGAGSSPVVSDGAPRKKPKISVKSNLILKGPDNFNTFNLERRLGFKPFDNIIRADPCSSPSSSNQSILRSNEMVPPDAFERMHNILNMNPISDLNLDHDSFIPNGLDEPNYLTNSNYSFPNMHSANIMDGDEIPDQTSHYILNNPEILGSNNNEIFTTEISQSANAADIKLENKPFVPNTSQITCSSMNDIFSRNNMLINEIPKHTIPMQIPIKFEDKPDILGSYLNQQCLFDNSASTVGMENISIIEELPVSYEDPEGISNTEENIYKDSYFLDNAMATELEEEREIIEIDDTSSDTKSLSVFGGESKFGLIHERSSPFLNSVNTIESPLKRSLPPPFLMRQDSNDSKHVKEKPRIISEVHITSDKSKIMNFAAVKNLGLKLEYPLMKNIEWALAPKNAQQDKPNS